MKKANLYIVLFVLVLNDTPLNQLSKVPLLLQHFREHMERDCSISFMDFLSMHYWGTDLDDNDDDRDRQLPFKDFQITGQPHLFVPLQRAYALQTITPDRPVNHSLEKDFHLPQPSISDLFRPPRA